MIKPLILRYLCKNVWQTNSLFCYNFCKWNLPDYLSINLFVCCRILIIIFIFRQFWVDGRLSFDKTVRKKELCTLSFKEKIDFSLNLLYFFIERSWSVGGWSRLYKADLVTRHIFRQWKSCKIPCCHSGKPISQNNTQRRNTSQVFFKFIFICYVFLFIISYFV